VPEIVEADGAGKPSAFEQRLEVVVGEGRGTHDAAGECGEDQVVIFPKNACCEAFGVLAGAVTTQRLKSAWREMHGAGPASLGRGECGTVLGGGAFILEASLRRARMACSEQGGAR
jgi:hypothetical protein